ncbi:MAG: sigma-54 dependent transcriptional regulator, partial [Pseudomonadota bacterium]|nr:sigma-54 dependent transcriptional regulator [Pseudomonadota bacterium]
MSRILIVDDDTAGCRALQLHLQAQGHEAATAHSVDEALAAAGAGPPELVIMDIRMPGRSGLEGLVELKKDFPGVRVIMITAFHDMESTIEAMQKGAEDYIHKPIDIDELDRAVAKALREAGERIAVEGGARELPGSLTMVGRSRSMKEVFKTIGLVAKSPATLLVTGESGTGKELVARAVHRAGENPQGPFVVVNCAALVETLLESDMFGHERGAFTGAVNRQIGKFALARGGTLFLDEISELSPAMQAKLLRVLQYKEFMPLGAQRVETTDARILAATNVDLAQRVTEGRFREDLFFRLQVVNIHLPPLRERMEDLPHLVETLLARINRETGRRTTHLAADVVDCFRAWPWPGNVRELENRLMKAVALCPDTVLTRELFAADLCSTPALAEADRPLNDLSLA